MEKIQVEMDVAQDKRWLFEDKNENYLLELELHSLEFHFLAELLTQNIKLQEAIS